ncbi:MAG: lytic transglycosylase domain-containing protein [Elusimicrobiota bacterium]|jgi:soluble lytic murein transglycosylase|nr:lytic transglycosylase domain-containing protein [Elusimicrobiota bacterium]
MIKPKKRYIALIIIVLFALYGLFYIQKTTGVFYRIIYRDIINHYSNRFNIDPLLISAVMRKESSINPNAVSKKGAMGLMQLMPATAREIAQDLNVKNYTDDMLKKPELNVMLGSYYLYRLLRRYDNDLIMTLGAYNAGIGNIDVVRFMHTGEEVEIEDLPFEETRRYVKAILFTYNIYKGLEKIKQFPSNVVKELTN